MPNHDEVMELNKAGYEHDLAVIRTRHRQVRRIILMVAAGACMLVASIGGSAVGCRYIDRRNPDPCTACLENVNSTWRCDKRGYWPSDTDDAIEVCAEGRTSELAHCIRLCREQSDVE